MVPEPLDLFVRSAKDEAHQRAGAKNWCFIVLGVIQHILCFIGVFLVFFLIIFLNLFIFSFSF